MYVPKRKNWNSLNDLKAFLEKETSEKVSSFNGWELITDTTVYTISFGQLHCNEVKRASEGIKGRSNGSTTNKERVGTHGGSDHVKPDGEKTRKIRSARVPKKVSKPKKAPK